ncbi:DeoR/GlpR family DNA-binding transcription regulator [Rhodospirillum rubrum]|uniref:Transcriptional regulator, DeoR family n=1 Tax=Rhodospirillum rubrum (strain ATCC 11170 / ATH 1.1.1 / DSM 467 / LMG 4362 / NCIMB 8255 / S1) TaxID=269796 RepID=Q2RUX9_RHORT|nr:DeoR/GlpR family DNA-binding transcription regulator [Rhodospirillum rubrum]ABC22066.1 transcriptional regulator, DeoR family [Rhodospirillum rubrum ATCC 11170]AEO47778.1 DeoR family transcriptional regulator [Rhodospirillum rubrum F11]MBK5953649.1 DeoR family transcriptional regulator [Rhodospirillum rubrum]QXG81719.1 DeoR/GlpR family DNA-binding transcription regulator [Rhodospirillum rubrum]HCF17533.1 DeoR/GlpR transcriptional regulator [Rhodospirillum rubrum]
MDKGSEELQGQDGGQGRRPGAARRAAVQEVLQESGYATVADLARRLEVSEMTIRRDLSVMEEDGAVVRTHGGALSVSVEREGAFDREEPAFEQRRRQRADVKQRIAQAAARLAYPRGIIGLDSGTSSLALAEELAQESDLRVFTNNIRASTALVESRNLVYLLGGQVRHPEMSVIGPMTVNQIRGYYFDQFFVGLSGCGPAGIFDYSLEDTEVKQAFIERSGTVIALCDSSKFGRHALAQICPLDRIDILVTDAPPPPPLAQALVLAEVRVILADPAEGPDLPPN